MRKQALPVLVTLCAAVLVHSASGQVPYRTYAPPSGPTLPYQLDYFRPQSGVLDQYNQFVAPKEQLANQLGSMAQRQNADFQAVESKFRESDRIRESRAAPTGVSAGFMNYSHYYGSRGGGGGGAARQRRQAAPTTSMPGLYTGIGMGFGT